MYRDTQLKYLEVVRKELESRKILSLKKFKKDKKAIKKKRGIIKKSENFQREYELQDINHIVVEISFDNETQEHNRDNT